MKVKGIERAQSQHKVTVFRLWSSVDSNCGDARAGKGKTGRRLARFSTAALLSIALTLVVAVAPYKAVSASADKKAAEKMHKEGQKAIRKGEYDKAIKLYDKLLDMDGLDVSAYLGSALAHLKENNYRRSFSQATQAINIEPDNARAHALAGISLLRSGYVAHAVSKLVEAFRLNPKEALAHGGAAEIDYYEGRSKEARLRALQAHTLDPNEPDYLITYARAASRIESFIEAAEAYERFLRVAPKTDSERRERIEGLIRFYRQLAGIQIHDISGPKTTDVHFNLGADRRPYIKLKVNGRDATFVIDTGSGFTVISKEAAKELRVSEIARGGKSQGVGGDGKFKIVYGLIGSLEFGDVKIKAVPCFIRPFHGRSIKDEEYHADGFIGLSVLSRFLTELDYKENVMRLNRFEEGATPVAYSPDTTIIPFRTTQNGLISVETQLDDSHNINAILDSGASSTVISTAAVERLKLRDSIIKGQTVRVIGAAGISDNVELLLIRNCRVADLRQENLRALVLDFEAINETSGFEQSGILGGDFLRNFRVTIDFMHTRIVLQPHSQAIIRNP